MEKPIDSIVESVVKKFQQRSEVGIKKYNKTLDRTDLSYSDWLNHLQEELMDAVLYCERLRNEAKSDYLRGYQAAAEVYSKMYDKDRTK